MIKATSWDGDSYACQPQFLFEVVIAELVLDMQQMLQRQPPFEISPETVPLSAHTLLLVKVWSVDSTSHIPSTGICNISTSDPCPHWGVGGSFLSVSMLFQIPSAPPAGQPAN